MDDSARISTAKKESITKHIKELHAKKKSARSIAKSVLKNYKVKLIA